TMKKTLFITALLSLLSISVTFAQNTETPLTEKEKKLMAIPDDDFMPFRTEDEYVGYKLKSTGEIVIPAIYDKAFPYKHGLAIVDKDGYYGTIDHIGRVVTPYKYDSAYEFKDGMARVVLDSKSGYIDSIGVEVIPPLYTQATNFNDGLAAVQKDFDKWGYINKKGEKVIPINLTYTQVYYFSEGKAWVRRGEAYGYIDTKAKLVIPLKYDWAMEYSEGLAAVMKDGKWGIIDHDGNVVIPFKYQGLTSFSQGRCTVLINGKWGCIDREEKLVIPAIYERPIYFESNKTAKVYKDGKSFFIDIDGNVVNE
ncbi:MAG: WG repeat-containing protein, partial [Flavobacteriales bacterium]|nr:WG repeat-containing protein [Flavobacteriales bacterium]